jgi:hypothetical protein
VNKKTKKFHYYWFGMLGGPIIFLIVLAFSVMGKVNKLKRCMSVIQANANEENAIKLLNELNTIGKCQKPLMTATVLPIGMPYITAGTWAMFFNRCVNPSAHIAYETKEEIRNCLVNLSVVGLDRTLTENDLSTPAHCPNCKNKLTENTLFCPNCGTKLG